MEFREIGDCEWELIRSLLPPRARVGRPRIDDRRVLNVFYMCLLLAVDGWMDGWICLVGMGIT
ncbi:MAG: hypothetical protein QXX95_00670 [Nitrososphaerales archaeon]